MYMNRRKYKIPTDEHTRYYGRQGDRNPHFVFCWYEIKIDDEYD